MEKDLANKNIKDVIVSDPSELRGDYCNLAAVHHTENEFVFDYIFKLGSQGQLVSRIITNHQHAKALFNALKENIKIYESEFGTIKEQKRNKAEEKIKVIKPKKKKKSKL